MVKGPKVAVNDSLWLYDNENENEDCLPDGH